MRAELAAAAAVVIAAVAGVRHWEAQSAARLASGTAAGAALDLAPARASAKPSQASAWSDEVRVRASVDHQFYVTAAVNAAPLSFLVDTGASFVALRDSDARRAGIYTAWKDFDHPVRTANGETKAALIDIRAIEINGIRVENVKAFILADEQLSVNLLGMSFLSRLKSVESRGGELLLRG